KMVPSATPAASAIWRVLTAIPCSRSNGTVAAIRAARRSSGAIAGTRRRGAAGEEEGVRTAAKLTERVLTHATPRRSAGRRGADQRKPDSSDALLPVGGRAGRQRCR